MKDLEPAWPRWLDALGRVGEQIAAPEVRTARAHLEIRLRRGPVTQRAVTDPRIVIGRSPSVELCLDHDTVSRRHAELTCDPFGRFWIRDLGSTNGTIVNGERVTERQLVPGDRFRIGDYTLVLHVAAPNAGHFQQGDDVVVTEETPQPPSTLIKILEDAEPPKISARHLSTLMDLNRRLLETSDATERLDALCQLAVHPDFRGTLALALRTRGTHVVKVLSGPHRPKPLAVDDTAFPYVSRRVLKALRERGKPVMATNVTNAPSEPASLELTISSEVIALSAIACPLRCDDATWDVLYVTLPPEYGTEEWLALLSLAAEAYVQAETVWDARRHAELHAAVEQELDTARRIQRALVPASVSVPGVEVALGFEPCRWVGGDYVDAIPMPDGRVLLAVADVCGKGLQAALVTFSIHTMVRATIEAGRSPVDTMEQLNRHLCSYLPEDSFATMVCVALDPATGKLECINAGHPPALILTRTGCSRQLQAARNPALGVMPMTLTPQEEQLGDGDLLALYTDGLTEARNGFGHMLGEEQLTANLARLFGAMADAPLADVARELSASVEAFRGDRTPEDDTAFVLARRTFAPEVSAATDGREKRG